ncbi:hypothetical protein [Streptomyces viridosporus]|uniref:hypothetical protein n=1 Tax=Streptomyces viridosporus TaxID=67581 RepID=UPI0036F738CB
MGPGTAFNAAAHHIREARWLRDHRYLDDYYAVLRAYALIDRKDGKPYVAEAHHPDEDRWI